MTDKERALSEHLRLAREALELAAKFTASAAETGNTDHLARAGQLCRGALKDIQHAKSLQRETTA